MTYAEKDISPKDISAPDVLNADAAPSRLPTEETIPPTAPLRIMTFNALYHGARNAAGDWPTRRLLASEVIAEWKPSVVGFQEVTELQLAQMSEDHKEYDVLPGPVSGRTRLPAWARRGERVQDAGEWCPLFYRRDQFHVAAHGAFWLSHRSDEAGSVLPGTWLPRVVNWARFEEKTSGGLSDVTGAAFSVFNTHVDFLPWATRRSAHILWERLKQYWDGAPQIVMGDFNAAPGSSIHRCLLRDCQRHAGTPSFRDAWESAVHRKGPTETFHAGRGRRQWQGRIDHIFFRPSRLSCGALRHHHPQPQRPLPLRPLPRHGRIWLAASLWRGIRD